MECGRQDSNLHGLPRSPSRARGSSSTGFQSQRVCQFRHARYAWCLRSGTADLDSRAVSSSCREHPSTNAFMKRFNERPTLGQSQERVAQRHAVSPNVPICPFCLISFCKTAWSEHG